MLQPVGVCFHVYCDCPAGWEQGYGDSCYKLGAAQGSWQKDKHDCESELLGHMLFVNNPAELNIVAGMVGYILNASIGRQRDASLREMRRLGALAFWRSGAGAERHNEKTKNLTRR